MSHCLHWFICHGLAGFSLLTIGGGTDLEYELVPMTSEDPRVPELLGAGAPGTPKRGVLALGAVLVGLWYLTCLSSCSISSGAGLNGELKIPGRWKARRQGRLILHYSSQRSKKTSNRDDYDWLVQYVTGSYVPSSSSWRENLIIFQPSCRNIMELTDDLKVLRWMFVCRSSRQTPKDRQTRDDANNHLNHVGF